MYGLRPLHAQIKYKVAAASKVSISGTSTVSDWVVHSEQVSGEMIFLSLEKKPPATEIQKGTIREGKAILEVSRVKSEKGEVMNNKMHKALKSDEHPQIIFSLTEPMRIENSPAQISATGDVQIAGVTRPMTFDLKYVFSDNSFRFKGSKSLKLSDFNIEPPTAMFGQIETGDEIVVELDLIFTQ
jgi:hypothetical protein